MLSQIKIAILWSVVLVLTVVTLLVSFQRVTLQPTVFFKYTKGLLNENEELLREFTPENAKTIEDNSYKVLKTAPLSSAAIAHLNITKFANADYSQKIQIAQLVERRNARERSNLRFLLHWAIVSANYEDFFLYLDLLYRLDFKNHVKYDNVLIELLGFPEGLQEIDKRLSLAPSWGRRLIYSQIKFADKKAIVRLESAVRSYSKGLTGSGEASLFLIENYLNQLIEYSLYDEAYEFWLSVLVEAELPGPQETSTFNVNFFNLNAPPPFNWKVYSDENLTSRFLDGGGLEVSSISGHETLVFRQVFPFNSSRSNALDFEVSFINRVNKGHLKVVGACSKTGELMFTVAIKHEEKNRFIQKTEIPQFFSDCNFLNLKVFAIPEQPGKTIIAKVHSVSLSSNGLK